MELHQECTSLNGLSFTIRVVLAVTAIVTNGGLMAQDSTVSRQPTVLSNVSVVSADVQAARDVLFAPYVRSLPTVSTESPGTPPRVSSMMRRPLPELPSNSANTIIVGSLVSTTSRLLSSNNGIYAEYQLTLSKILKAPPGVIQNNSLNAVEVGGAVVLSDGRIVRHIATGIGSQLEAGRQYLMFLNFQPAAKCFRIVKVWEFRDGKAVATADDDKERVRRGTSQINGSDFSQLITMLLPR